MTTKNAAQKWYDAAVEQHEKFRSAWRRARVAAMEAGFLFMKARELCGHGDWLPFLELNAAKMKPRTVQFYIQFAEAAIGWVKTAQPGIADGKVQAAAMEIVVQSPKPLVALLRDLREMRPFGEYDAVRYAQRKNGEGQLELNFGKVVASLDVFEQLDRIEWMDLPEGKTEEQALSELHDKLEAAARRIESRLKTVEV